MTLLDTVFTEVVLKRERMLKIILKDYEDLVKIYIVFLSPADIKGTAFLTWENRDKDDTQYLYLPELGRARRIVSSQKKLKFVNTDYTYEDMQRRRPEKDNHALIGEEPCGERMCYVVESIPKDKSQYSKRVTWVEKESFVVVRVDFYDKKGRKSKEFFVDKLEKIGGIWTAAKTTMRDLKRNHTTIMDVIEVKYDQGVLDSVFTLRNLEASR